MPATEHMDTTCPRSEDSSSGRNCCRTRIWPNTLTEKTFSISDMEKLRNGLAGMIPALLNTIVTGPDSVLKITNNALKMLPQSP